MPTEEELIQERTRKLDEIRRIGVNPYPYSYKRTHNSTAIKTQFEKLQPEEEDPTEAKVAGRIVGLRRMGQLTFMHIQDEQDKLQIVLRKDVLGDQKYGFLKLLDMGDWIGANGNILRTKRGELSVNAKDFELLCKSLRSLPEKWHGLQDTELRYRQRYVDLIVNPDVKKTMLIRSKIIQLLREFFHEKGFVEVETPVLQSIYGGANARPFTTHHHDLDMKMYLRISLELYHKRLIVGGLEKVFEIGHVFRNEGIDREHNPEFTLLECYQAYADYNDMMELTEDVYNYVTMKLFGTTKITYQDNEIDFKKPWKRISMIDAIQEYGNVDVKNKSDDELIRLTEQHNVQIDGEKTRGKLIAGLFEELCEDKLIQPTFIIDHPIETTPLCKPLRDGDQNMVERFEPFINTWEIGNAYSELNDPVLQRKLLEDQASALRAGDLEAQPMDEDFVRSIEQGMPPTGGLGLGIDRMIMLLTNSPSIRDVIFFPTMKPKE